MDGSLLLRTKSGTSASFEVQEEFNNVVHRGKSDVRFIDTVEVKSTNQLVEEAWEELTPEQKESFLATNPNVARFGAFIEAVAPVSVLWMLPDGVEAQVQNAIDINPGAARPAEVLGTVIGLVGGPFAWAKTGQKLIKHLRKHGARKAGYRSAKAIKEAVVNLKREARNVYANTFKRERFNGKSIEEASDIAGTPASKIWDSARELQDFLDDWGEFAYDQRRTIDEMRDFLGQRTNGLSPNHPLAKALGGPKATRNVFDLSLIHI